MKVEGGGPREPSVNNTLHPYTIEPSKGQPVLTRSWTKTPGRNSRNKKMCRDQRGIGRSSTTPIGRENEAHYVEAGREVDYQSSFKVARRWLESLPTYANSDEKYSHVSGLE